MRKQVIFMVLFLFGLFIPLFSSQLVLQISQDDVNAKEIYRLTEDIEATVFSQLYDKGHILSAAEPSIHLFDEDGRTKIIYDSYKAYMDYVVFIAVRYTGNVSAGKATTLYDDIQDVTWTMIRVKDNSLVVSKKVQKIEKQSNQREKDAIYAFATAIATDIDTILWQKGI